MSVITLNRKRLALELKHITNEKIRDRQRQDGHIDIEGYYKDKIDTALKNDRWKQTPIFVICRDRISPLLELIEWLESAGMNNIILVDNDSQYPDLLDYYAKTPYQVIYTGKNIGHTVVWAESIARTLYDGEFYIVTDPDVIPDKSAPKDSVKYFFSIHRKYLQYKKVGFGLQIDDLPEHYSLRDSVVQWESQFWKNELKDGLFEAGIDTTFALYKPFTDFYTLHPSIRTGRPYTAMHLPWYIDSSELDTEEAFYRMHARQDVTSWNVEEILDRYKKELG